MIPPLPLAALGATALRPAPVRHGGAAGKFEPAKCVAEGSEVVVVVNVRTILNAPIVKKGELAALLNELKDNELAKELHKATGIDVFNDVETIVLSGSGQNAKDAKVFVVIRGSLGPEKV